MKTFFLGLLHMVITKIIDKGLFEYIKELVAIQFNTELSGDEKKAQVKARLKEAKGELFAVAESTSNYLINLAIEVAVTLLKDKTTPK